MAWVRGKKESTLYVSGHPYPCPTDLAERLTAERELRFDKAPGKDEKATLLALLNDGHLATRKGRRR
jgi:50S ribosomal protein L16 3-hydroxylase